MKLNINSNCEVNKYYIQTLCMIFFPGEKFSEQKVSDDVVFPILNLDIDKRENGVNVVAEFVVEGKSAKEEKFTECKEGCTLERNLKIAIGNAITAAGGSLLGYRPPWGMLTGVRPTKLVSEMLEQGLSRTKIKKILGADYSVIPKKASLVTEIANLERKLTKREKPEDNNTDCSIYISIPFCPSRCAYCSFVSYSSKKLLTLIPDYLIMLADEVRQTFDIINNQGLKVKTVYIGGGTPSILTSEQMEYLFSVISECTDISQLEEFTFESGRPDTITTEKLVVAKAFGVTRICVNPQTLNDLTLKEIGRNHTADDFFEAFDIAKNSGIKHINTDLIAGLSGDNFVSFSNTFDKIINLRPDNITVHTFCVKKSADILKQGSQIYSYRGGDVSKCVDYSQMKAIQAGYKPYYMYRQKNTVGNCENVGFALEGAEGLYNIYMMEEIHSIFAIGAGAVTKLVRYNTEGVRKISRLFNPKYPYEYLSEGIDRTRGEAVKSFFEKKPE